MNKKVSQQRMAEEVTKAGLPSGILTYLAKMSPGTVERNCVYVRSVAHKFGVSDEQVDDLFERASLPLAQE